MIKRFRMINDKLYRGGNLSPKDVFFLKKKFNIVKIISLDINVAKLIDRTTKLLNIKHIVIPIYINKKTSLLKLFNYNIINLLEDDSGAVFVGCKQGKDRTGLVIAMYRCEKQGWSCSDAIREAKQLGFGIGIDPKITSLYLKIIKRFCECEDTNDAYDIVSNQREYPSDYADYTLDSFEQGSWSPYEDYRVKEDPYTKTEIDWPEQYQSRQDFGLDDRSDMDYGRGFPQSGTYDTSTSGINGAGPSLVGSGYI